MFYNNFITSLNDTDFQNIQNVLLQKFAISVKTNNDVYILKHENNDPALSDVKNRFDNETDLFFYNNTRGLIVDLNTHKPLCLATSLHYLIDEFPYDDIHVKYDDLEFQEAISGTNIRLYCHMDRWFFATTNSYDCSKTYVNGTNNSYVELFFDIMGDTLDFTQLNKNCTYHFVLSHPLNRNVYPTTEKSITIVSVIDNNTMQLQHDDYIYSCKNIKTISTTNVDSNNFDECKCRFREIKHIDDPCDKFIGYLFYDKKNRVYYRNHTTTYETAKKLLSGSQDYYHLYIRLRKEDSLTLYTKYFPSDIDGLMCVEMKFTNLMKKLYQLYGLRFKRHSSNDKRIMLGKEHGFDPFIHYEFLKGIHKYYMDVLAPNGLTVQEENIIYYLLHIANPDKLTTSIYAS